jgi:hypothetical protein
MAMHQTGDMTRRLVCQRWQGDLDLDFPNQEVDGITLMENYQAAIGKVLRMKVGERGVLNAVGKRRRNTQHGSILVISASLREE